MRALSLLPLLVCGCALLGGTSSKPKKQAKAPKPKEAPAPPELTAIAAKTRPTGRPFRYFVIDLQRTIGALEEGKRRRASLMKLFNAKQRALNEEQAKLQAQTLEPAELDERKKALKARHRKMQGELDMREQQELSALMSNLRTHVRGHLEVEGAPEGFELLDGAKVLLPHGRCDISDWLIDSYNRGVFEPVRGPACFALHVHLLRPGSGEAELLLTSAKAVAKERNALLLVHDPPMRAPQSCDATEWFRRYALGEQTLSGWPPACPP